MTPAGTPAETPTPEEDLYCGCVRTDPAQAATLRISDGSTDGTLLTAQRQNGAPA